MTERYSGLARRSGAFVIDVPRHVMKKFHAILVDDYRPGTVPKNYQPSSKGRHAYFYEKKHFQNALKALKDAGFTKFEVVRGG